MTNSHHELLTQIAHKHLGMDTLETRNSDSLDFREASVWSVKAALEEAYAEGRRSLTPINSNSNTKPLVVDSLAYHRNGICGAPFHVILFEDSEQGKMLGIVFDAPHHVAVLHLGRLAEGDIRFGSNAWRGDWYEPILRRHLMTEV